MLHYFRSIPVDCPFLFYRQDKNKTYHSFGDFRKAWHYCLGLAELKDVRFHDSRHCAATDLYDNGNAERVIMDIAGWKTPMLSTYRHKDSLKSAQIIKFSSVPGKSDTVPADKVINF
jgi:integrase